MKIFNKKNILLSSVLVASLLFGVGNNVQAASSSNASHAVSRVSKNNEVSKIVNSRFSKYGYNVRILNRKYVDPIYVGTANYKHALKSFVPLKNAKTINPAKVKNIKFKIVKETVPPKNAGSFAPIYLVVSKDKKYSCWTSQTYLQYYYFNAKDMQGVTKPLKRIANRSTSNLKNTKNKKDFASAMKAAKKLSKNKRDFVIKSLNRLKKDGNLDHLGDDLLTFGLI